VRRVATSPVGLATEISLTTALPPARWVASGTAVPLAKALALAKATASAKARTLRKL
jgi:hypothetical protein